MMRGPAYDDSYLSRKMGGMQLGPPLPSYRAAPSYLQGYLPPPRLPPRYAPSYYDYDYGYNSPSPYSYSSPYSGSSPYAGYGMYGGYMGGGYTPLPAAPRLSRYDNYLDDDYEVNYPPRYRPGGLTEAEKDKIAVEAAVVRARSCSPLPSETTSLPYRRIRYTSPVTVRTIVRSRSPHTNVRAIEAPPSSHSKPLVTEGDRHYARMQARYPTLSEPQMLQDQVDKMRIRLKALAYSLDPSGPVPEIVVPTRSKTTSSDDKKYSSALDNAELPRLSTRRHHYYPEDDHMKDNLGIKCLSHYKNTRTQAVDDSSDKVLGTYTYSGKNYIRGYGASYSGKALPDYSSKYSSRSLAKWEEPDTIYGPSTDRKPYSKTTDGGDDEERKERRKKKKSRERDELSCTDLAASVPESAASASALDDAAAASSEPAVDGEAEPELDEKEKKRLEKKKRKAEREAAAKAAMEAELEALATAELELARLEQESAILQSGEAAPAADAAPEAPADAAAEK